MKPETRYARSGDVHIAYQVVGEGPLDLVLRSRLGLQRRGVLGGARRRPLSRAPGLVRAPDPLRQARHRPLRPGGRASRISRRGWTTCGRSWTPSGSARAALLGYSEGGADVRALRRDLPGADAGLVLDRQLRADDLGARTTPGAAARGVRSASCERSMPRLGRPGGPRHPGAEPGRRRAVPRWWARFLRMSASPGAAAALLRMNAEIDVRHVLPAIRVPTLVLHRARRASRARRGGPLPRRAHPRGAVRRAARHRPPAVGRRRRRDRRRGRGVPDRRAGRRGARPGPGDRAVHRYRRTPRAGQRSSATAAGATCSTPTTRWSASIWSSSGAARSTRRATASWPLRRPGPGDPLRRRRRGRAPRARGPGRAAHRRVRGASATSSAASRSTSAARVAALAKPGEVLVSSTVKDLVAGSGLASRTGAPTR